jgi:hypothetical protein
MSHDNEISNQSSNTSFEQMLDTYLARHTILKGGLTAALVTASNYKGQALFKNSQSKTGKTLRIQIRNDN